MMKRIRPVLFWVHLVYGPPSGGPADSSTNSPALVQRTADARPLPYDALVAVVKREVPDWETMTFRFGGGRSRGAADGPDSGEQRRAVGESRRMDRLTGAGDRRLPPSAVVQVRTSGFAWVLPTQLILDPFTGAVLRRESVGELGMRRGLRQLNRTLHTGEAGGLPGQVFAFVACLGGLMLVYTGFALSWRRWRQGGATDGSREVAPERGPLVES